MNKITLSRRHRAPVWLLLMVLVLPGMLGACSLSSVEVRQSRTTTPPANRQATPVPTQQDSSQNNQGDQGNSSPGGSGGDLNSPPAQQADGSAGAAWQIPAEQQAVVRVVEQVNPAVVTVVNKLDPRQSGFSGEARGSGVVIDEEGRIITNNHVIEGAVEGGLQVIFIDGTIAPAQLIGADPGNDLAVLKVDTEVKVVATLADSSKVKVGETVIAIGSALGDFTNPVTVGVVSGTNRDLEGQEVQLENLIQTDAAINHGNSGGPLLNLSGEVIGINTAVVRGDGSGVGAGDVAEGLGFAIPSNRVRTVAGRIIQQEGRPRPFLGVATEPVTPQLASYYDLRGPNGRLLSSGVLVVEVVPGSAAEDVGLAPGDVILSIDDTTLNEDNPLADVLAEYEAGQTVRLQVVRNGSSQDVDVTLGGR
ncbi:MAG TPA: trypsin-like peptidase domain-containing protein [Chloroflexia bacterium]|nr:trypsin-like peptidase domain-containing protein [Chloroflexia bacterium]